MKRFTVWILLLTFFFAFSACSGKTNLVRAPENVRTWSVESPDRALKVNLALDELGSVYYTVSKDGKNVIERSSLGFSLEEDSLAVLTFKEAVSNRVTGQYFNISGKHSVVEYDCNETILTFEGVDFLLDITMRAYDDGYAFRYAIRSQDGGVGEITVQSENTEFTLPQGSVVWMQPYISNTTGQESFSYEEAYTRKNISSLLDTYIAMPLLYKASDTDIYSLITESGLIGSGFYGSFLIGSYEDGVGVVRTVHSPAGVADPDNVISYPFESPWRVGIVGSLKEVVESELVEKVYDDAGYWRPENYDELTPQEQETYNYEWVETGLSAWNWLKMEGQNEQYDYDMQKEYVDLACEMGWKYTILDATWELNHTPLEIKEFMDYAHARGIKVIVWCNALPSFANGNAEVLRSKLARWKLYGIDGIKIDFFDGQGANNPPHSNEDIQTIQWYETIYQETAKQQMVVICHGSNKPTGERRVYPHVFGREAIRGNEWPSIDSSVIINFMFTRGIIGPSDFTPTVLPVNEGLSMGLQMALAVLFETGCPVMADTAEVYRDPQINSFYQSVPALRDDTLFLCGEPDMYYCAAIKSGDDWFVAGINTILPTEVSLDFSFLDGGDYTATFYVNAEDINQVDKTTKIINAQSDETIQMRRNGGFVIHLTQNEN